MSHLRFACVRFGITASRYDLGAGGAKRVVERVPGLRRPLNPRVAAHKPPAYDDCATMRQRPSGTPPGSVARLLGAPCANDACRGAAKAWWAPVSRAGTRRPASAALGRQTGFAAERDADRLRVLVPEISATNSFPGVPIRRLALCSRGTLG